MVSTEYFLMLEVVVKVVWSVRFVLNLSGWVGCQVMEVKQFKNVVVPIIEPVVQYTDDTRL